MLRQQHSMLMAAIMDDSSVAREGFMDYAVPWWQAVN
jgi:hypothetical protein